MMRKLCRQNSTMGSKKYCHEIFVHVCLSRGRGCTVHDEVTNDVENYELRIITFFIISVALYASYYRKLILRILCR